MFEIKRLSNNQPQDIKSILMKSKEVFMGPVRPAEMGKYRNYLKPGVMR